ncbi:hypothetical protein L9F63_009790 [Diploptera punctata]|uniref:Ionotropic glutamate receptor C-terminal domain-containing protein n=1 Tax=Diploptera punctata TaxID=6984 RepID=A0AAD8AJ34_DIPPU|nr:hypothetical protein L9F63_009790 [Diploptera punctata]
MFNNKLQRLLTERLWILLQIQLCRTSLQQQFSDNNSSSIFLDVISYISDHYLPKDLPLIMLTLDIINQTKLPYKFILNQSCNNLLPLLFEDKQRLMLTYGVNKNLDNIIENKPGSAILFLNSEDSKKQTYLQEVMVDLMKKGSWNPRAKYVIVSTAILSSESLRNDFVNLILSIASTRFIYNIVVLIPKTNSESNVIQALDIYTWFPYTSEQQCGKHVSQAVRLDSFLSSHKNNGLLNNANLFPAKDSSNYNECHITFFVIEWPPLTIRSNTGALNYHEGLEIRILQTVSKLINFKIVYLERLNESEAYFGSKWIKPETLRSYDATWTHYRGAVAWFVPREREVPRWKSLIKVFVPMIWTFLVLSYVTTGLTFWLIGKCCREHRKEHKCYTGIVGILMNTLSILLSESVNVKPRAGIAQMFFIIWVIFCLVVSSAYQSFLIGYLTNPGHLPSIQNTKELVDSGINFGILKNLDVMLKAKVPNPEIEQILSSYSTCYPHNLTYCLDRMSYVSDIAVLGGRVGIEFKAYVNYTHNGKTLFVPFDDNLLEGYMSFHFQKGHLLLERFSVTVMRLQSAGIIDRWVYEIRLKYGNWFNKDLSEKDFNVLCLTHVLGAFYVLLLGIILSTVSFLLEVFSSNWNECM